MEEIFVEINNINDIYSEFSSETTKVLKKSFAQHLEETCEEIDRDTTITIRVSKKFNEQEKETAVKTIKKYYNNHAKQNSQEIKRNTLLSFVLLVISIGLIVALHFLNEMGVSYIISLLLEIVAWVFAWEFTDVLFFKCTGLRHEKIKNLTLLNCKIDFINTVKKLEK